jgi:prepilin-type processing-associated H-X9-DG protein
VVSWRVQLLPFLNQQTLRGQYTDDEPWDAETNLPVARTQLDVYSCPASQYPRDDVQRAHAAIALVTGPGTCFPDGKGMALDDVTDGTNATILLGEACGQNIVWTEPRDADVSRVPPGINRPGQRPQTSHGLFSSSHPGGANVFFADGRGQFLSERMDPAVLMKLTTPAAGDAVTDF